MDLYFIALIPDEPLREEVRKLKLEMSDRFGSKHALKSPAHITLQMPFKRHFNYEKSLLKILNEVMQQNGYFSVKISGFGCFTPRVIFLNIVNKEHVKILQSKLSEKLKTNLLFEPKELTRSILPHMTIATRDLTKHNFFQAWNTFKNRNFEAEFLVKHLYLLKHNGKYWDIFERSST